MAQVYLVCEGERNSLDVRLLDAVLAQYYKLPIVIEPAGGGSNPRIVRRWLERRVSGDIAFLIHDRDYEPLAEIDAGWQDPDERSLFWRSHEIENHLLQPWLIHGLFENYRGTINKPWVADLPADQGAIDTALRVLSPRLFIDHIGRTLCRQLRQHKTSLGATELNVPAGIDPLASTVAEWQAGIQGQIAQMHATCNAVINSPEFQVAEITDRWAGIEQTIQAPAFLTSGEYLRDLKGKRLLDLFWNYLHNTCQYPATKDDLANDLIATTRRDYHTSPAHSFADFDSLNLRLRAACGLYSG
ncbi:hypothetical protein ACYOEI_15210 [Singulisphaera rosea]